MFSKSTFPSILTLIMFANFSFGQIHYSPDDGDMSGLREKKDLHFSTSFQTSLFSSAPENFQMEIGYSPFRFLGIQSSYFWQKNSSFQTNNEQFDGSYQFYNISLGGYYFFPRTYFLDYKNKKRRPRRKPLISKKSKWIMKKGLLLDLYLGYGEGSSNIYFTEPEFQKLRFQKFYAQLGLHWYGKVVGFSFTSRIGRIHFYKLKGFLIGWEGKRDLGRYNTILQNKQNYMHELNLRFFLGAKHLRYFLNFAATTRASEFYYLNQTDYNINMGIIAEIDNFLKKEKKKSRYKKKKK